MYKSRTNKRLADELQDVEKRIEQLEKFFETIDINMIKLETIEKNYRELNELTLKSKSVRLNGETNSRCILPDGRNMSKVNQFYKMH